LLECLHVDDVLQAHRHAGDRRTRLERRGVSEGGSRATDREGDGAFSIDDEQVVENGACRAGSCPRQQQPRIRFRSRERVGLFEEQCTVHPGQIGNIGGEREVQAELLDYANELESIRPRRRDPDLGCGVGCGSAGLCADTGLGCQRCRRNAGEGSAPREPGGECVSEPDETGGCHVTHLIGGIYAYRRLCGLGTRISDLLWLTSYYTRERVETMTPSGQRQRPCPGSTGW